jgi:hypothetical protein
VTQDLSSLAQKFTGETTDADEEHHLIRELRSEIQGDDEEIRRLVRRLPEASSYVRRRIVRALDGWIPLETQSFSDFTISSDPRYLYYLVRSLEQPLRSDVFEDLKPLVNRDSTALAGAAAAVLAKSYGQDQEFIASLLDADRRDPIRIEVLKELYDRGADNFTDALLEVFHKDSSPSVHFYAAVLLVATTRHTGFDGSLPQTNLIESVRKNIDVSGFGAGGTQD